VGTVNINIHDTYRVESRLGAGGGGDVYKAWHTRLQKYVVLKKLNCGPSKNIATHRNEVEALKNVKNQYLPQVFDFVTENGHTYTVMEYIGGENFDKLLQHGCKFAETNALKWYNQLASALKALHALNICHRDIKPANIMLTNSGDVCLIDFDSALVGGKASRFVSRSPGYAPPEQYEIFDRIMKGRCTETAAAASFIDWKRADVYSLGASIYHILTGERPHELASKVVAVSKLGRFDPYLTHIIEKSMQPAPQNRYTSITEVAELLHKIVKIL
jgi:serine/threonine protein kinase